MRLGFFAVRPELTAEGGAAVGGKKDLKSELLSLLRKLEPLASWRLCVKLRFLFLVPARPG
ncbi:MAG: hypothetical protein A2V67_07905 [Deltaproteobacteria bacterium RBG_13_61_14]|nr:MAG: hypothetical protein A2V67_07905 [Deltaproteobacteria bacterium RBG_13_61_14]